VLELLSTILIFVAALLILVFVHELGHFLAAKACNMRVERFSLGFPPRVVGITVGETDYCLSATPLGGYVKISGMIDESMDVEHLDKDPEPWEFRSKPVWQRIVVISAGVIFNMILAFVIYSGISFSYGDYRIPMENVGGFYVPDSSFVAEMGFKTGDRVVEINDTEVEYFEQLVNPTELTQGEVDFTVERNGERVHIKAPKNFLDRINKGDYFSQVNLLPSDITRVQPGSPAEEVGVPDSSKILAINGDSVSYWMEVVNHIQKSDGPLTMTFLKKGEIIRLEVTPDPESGTVGFYNVGQEYFNVETVEYGFGESIVAGWKETGDMTIGIVQGFAKLISGDISVKQNLGGPVAIASFTKQATDAGGVRGFWEITAMLSVTLAIMNILPIPVLDGGHLVFLIYEGVTRREPSPKIRMVLQQIGFVLLVGLIIFVTFNDIMRQFGL
jgi:regulator of sigma E protease